jgi:predicted RNA-binding protein YlqC (UPF0109 family)
MAEEGNNEEVQLDESLFVQEEPTPKKEAPPAEEDTTAQEPKEDIPEKYQGKTAMEIIRMHQDAERLIGKQGNEVGELRKIVNDIVDKVDAQTSTDAAPKQKPDFFEDPHAATASTAKEVVDSDPELQEMKNTVRDMKKQSAAQALLRMHPDAAQLAVDPKFGAWVQKSKLRQDLFIDAHNNMNYEAAAELFDLYKETKAYNSDVADAAKNQRQEQLTKASTGSGKASSETRGKPKLSRQAIVDLRIRDPEEYQRILPQLKKAYAEGRVQ